MCLYHFYIFTTCGHSTLSCEPVIVCPEAPSNDALAGEDTICPRSETHPFRTHLLHSLCHSCQMRRRRLMSALQSGVQKVRFDEWRWRVAYRNPEAEAEGWRTWGEEARGCTLGVEEMERRAEALRRAKTGSKRGDGSSEGGSVRSGWR